MGHHLTDSYGRAIDYLRISVTDRCNLRCVYCLPPSGIRPKAQAEILTYEEILQVVEAAAGLGISKIRLTGGEPLVRAGLSDLVASLSAIPGVAEVSLTTNGLLLERYAPALAQAGLRRVNVSLDTLRAERFKRITGFDQFSKVWRGIKAAETVGLTPLKLNVVMLRGVNDDEAMDFARLTIVHDWHIRFIELMPIGTCQDSRAFYTQRHISTFELLHQFPALEPAGPVTGNGPARYYRLPDGRGTIGFITPISNHFCHECNRLRLTAKGTLRPCLFAEKELDLRDLLRKGATLSQLQKVIAEAVQAKPAGHRLDEGLAIVDRAMSEIGG
ncbi:MAG: GTP 3',8-cyclase MoaA [Anaerolineae bacterium]